MNGLFRDFCICRLCCTQTPHQREGYAERHCPFNEDISLWDVQNVGSMACTFFGCNSFNQDLSGWRVQNVVSFHSMFWGASEFEQNLNKWEIRANADTSIMFHGSGVSELPSLVPSWYTNP